MTLTLLVLETLSESYLGIPVGYFLTVCAETSRYPTWGLLTLPYAWGLLSAVPSGHPRQAQDRLRGPATALQSSLSPFSLHGAPAQLPLLSLFISLPEPVRAQCLCRLRAACPPPSEQLYLIIKITFLIVS